MLDVGLELNVLFDDPFWIGVFYLTNGDKCYVERVVFGQEPSDGEIYVYFLNTNKNASRFNIPNPIITRLTILLPHYFTFPGKL